VALRRARGTSDSGASGGDQPASVLLDYLEANHPRPAVAAAAKAVRRDIATHGRPGVDEFVASFADPEPGEQQGTPAPRLANSRLGRRQSR
jgi:hypothetical protein